MKGLVENVLDSIASRACTDVFASRRVLLRELPRPTVEFRVPAGQQSASFVAAMIGFTGLDVRGTLIMTTTFDVIDSARPSLLPKQKLSTSSWGDLVMARDWAGELTNQMLGRIKNSLRSFGIVLEAGLPTVFSGQAIAFAKPKSPAARFFAFDANGRRVWLCFDASFDESFLLLNSAEESAKEGDILLF